MQHSKLIFITQSFITILTITNLFWYIMILLTSLCSSHPIIEWTHPTLIMYACIIGILINYAWMDANYPYLNVLLLIIMHDLFVICMNLNTICVNICTCMFNLIELTYITVNLLIPFLCGQIILMQI